MNPARLSERQNIGQDWPDSESGAVASDHDPNTVLRHARQDLAEEGRQFADLLHGGSAATESSRSLPRPGAPQSGLAQPLPLTQTVASEPEWLTPLKQPPADPSCGSTPSDSDANLPSFGDHILQSLHRPLPATRQESAPPPAASPLLERIDPLADRLAQRILVSDRTQTGDSEVRIQLRETVLHGAEITIRRDHGQLEIRLTVADPSMVHQLLPYADELQQALAARLDAPLRVDVQVSSPDSAGHGQPGDGRSRQRRDPRQAWDADPGK